MVESIAIRTEGLTRKFGKTRAVDGLTLSVHRGEIFGFLGPNGAGKTTTIKMLTGQLRPTSGRAWVAGCDVVVERQALKPRIGVVFDSQNLYMRATARENLSFYARLYGAPRARVDDVLALVGLQDRARERVSAYSNGMAQRLVIARALLHQPEILFLDEPTRGLDPHVARQIRALAARLAREGTTVFLTTHDMEEADQLCDRVAMIDLGRIAALDTPERLKAAQGEGAIPEPTLEDVFIARTGKALAANGFM